MTCYPSDPTRQKYRVKWFDPRVDPDHPSSPIGCQTSSPPFLLLHRLSSSVATPPAPSPSPPVRPSVHHCRHVKEYVATLRELLEQLSEETTPQGLPRLPKAMLNDFSDKIEVVASKLSTSLPDLPQVSEDPFPKMSVKVTSTNTDGETPAPYSPGLRRRLLSASSVEARNHDQFDSDASAPIKLDSAAQAHIQKHRKIQEDLTDEMVTLAQRLKETSLVMSQSVQNTGKLLDSTEKAVEQSLANTGRANVRAMEIYSKSSKTTCFTWLLMFMMTCVFVMVVMLIRVT
ncbi:hypothetical protein ACFE04_002543 [Oxalis oulophora]